MGAPSGTIRTCLYSFISVSVLRYVFLYPCLVVPHQICHYVANLRTLRVLLVPEVAKKRNSLKWEFLFFLVHLQGLEPGTH